MKKSENIEALIRQTASNVGIEEISKYDYTDEDIIFVDEQRYVLEAYKGKVYANVFCFCKEGSLEADINDVHHNVNKGSVIICPSGTVVDKAIMSPDFRFGGILALTDRVIQEIMGQNIDFWNRIKYVRRVYLASLGEEDRENTFKQVSHLYEALRDFVSHSEMPFRKEMIRSMLRVIVLKYCSLIKQEEQGEENIPSKLTRTQTLFYNFLELLREEPCKHRPVSYYADKLCVTSKYLSSVCKSVSDRTASEHINDAVVGEIVRDFRDPDLSTKQIAQNLGFENLSFFCKFVKRYLGMTPSEYRKER